MLHEPQMAKRHREILPVASELSGLRQNWAGHKDRVAHLFVQRHGFTHFTRLEKRGVGGFPNQFRVAAIAGAFGQFAESEMAGEMTTCGFGKTVAGAVTKWRDDALDLSDLPEPDTADESHRGNVHSLFEGLPVDCGQLLGHLNRLARDAAVALAMCLRSSDVLRYGIQESARGADAPRRNSAHTGDVVLCQSVR